MWLQSSTQLTSQSVFLYHNIVEIHNSFEFGNVQYMVEDIENKKQEIGVESH
jgi:tetrahydromethanopterin S-methyltransferase subunit F